MDDSITHAPIVVLFRHGLNMNDSPNKLKTIPLFAIFSDSQYV